MAEELLATCRHHGRKVNQLISALHKMASTQVKVDTAQLHVALGRCHEETGDLAALRTWQGAQLLQRITKAKNKMADSTDVRYLHSLGFFAIVWDCLGSFGILGDCLGRFEGFQSPWSSDLNL